MKPNAIPLLVRPSIEDVAAVLPPASLLDAILDAAENGSPSLAVDVSKLIGVTSWAAEYRVSAKGNPMIVVSYYHASKLVARQYLTSAKAFGAISAWQDFVDALPLDPEDRRAFLNTALTSDPARVYPDLAEYFSKAPPPDAISLDGTVSERFPSVQLFYSSDVRTAIRTRPSRGRSVCVCGSSACPIGPHRVVDAS